MIIGGYTLHLYCDAFIAGPPRDPIHGWGDFPHEYCGETRSECIANARCDGWLISKKRQLCPKCSGKRK